MNNIIIELCAEDRARLDRLAEAMERRNCGSCVQSALEYKAAVQDDVQKKLAEAMAKASEPTETPKNTTEEAEAPTLPNTPPEEEKPTAKEDAPAEPTVTLEQIQQKVVQLAAGNGGTKKAKVREIINAYAKKVSDLPEDKWSEVWDKLTALESEG